MFVARVLRKHAIWTGRWWMNAPVETRHVVLGVPVCSRHDVEGAEVLAKGMVWRLCLRAAEHSILTAAPMAGEALTG